MINRKSTFLFAVVFLCAWSGYNFFYSGTKTAYIELSKVYDGFSLKKEYEKVAKTSADNNKSRIDSLELELQQLSMKIQSMDSVKEKQLFRQDLKLFMAKRNKFFEIKNSLEYKQQQDMREYDEKLWTQINTYVKQYGDEQGYDYIFGVSGTGNIMYAREHNNVTSQVINYINKKYNGE